MGSKVLEEGKHGIMLCFGEPRLGLGTLQVLLSPLSLRWDSMEAEVGYFHLLRLAD